jgi:hypothetical protein
MKFGWADFNNEGWLDVFVGAEGFNNGDSVNVHRSMLYVNNHNGTFTEVGHKAHCYVMS